MMNGGRRATGIWLLLDGGDPDLRRADPVGDRPAATSSEMRPSHASAARSHQSRRWRRAAELDRGEPGGEPRSSAPWRTPPRRPNEATRNAIRSPLARRSTGSRHSERVRRTAQPAPCATGRARPRSRRAGRGCAASPAPRRDWCRYRVLATARWMASRVISLNTIRRTGTKGLTSPRCQAIASPSRSSSVAR